MNTFNDPNSEMGKYGLNFASVLRQWGSTALPLLFKNAIVVHDQKIGSKLKEKITIFL
jgi:hypothetical protein